jgi:hypothetical protein
VTLRSISSWKKHWRRPPILLMYLSLNLLNVHLVYSQEKCFLMPEAEKKTLAQRG